MLTRIVFVLLVVLNLGVGAWWLVRRPPITPAVPAAVPGVPLLELAGDGAAAPTAIGASNPASATVLTEAPIATPPVSCAAVGPFASQAEAQAAQARLPPQATHRIATQAAPNRGWRVIVPPLPDAAQATAMAARLTQAGFADNFVMREGADTNAVALGRFGSEAAARRHAEAITAAGINARAEPLGAPRWWLQVGAADASALAALVQAAAPVPRRPLDCAQLGAG